MSQLSKILDQTIDYYDRNAEEFFRETVEVDMSEIYAPFLELLPTGGKILDAGCGSGRDSLYFSQNGFDVTAFDASAEMVRRASELTKLNVQQMRFAELNWTEEFDGIWACASLLHLPKSELANVFEDLIKALKTGGVMYVSFKEGSGETTENGRFFSYYSEEKLKKILQNHTSTQIIKCWVSSEVGRKNRQQNWVNFLIKKLD